MKTRTTFRFALTAIVAFALVITSCTKETDELFQVETSGQSNVPGLKSVTTSSGGNSVILYAGQTINVGDILFNDIDTDGDGQDDVLEVTYSLKNGWQLNELHFFIGSSLVQMPANKSGNPVVGQFPYSFQNLNGAASKSFQVPFSAINYTCEAEGIYFIAAHASVRLPVGAGFQTESAWGDGQRLVQRGNWAMYFNIDINCDLPGNPGDGILNTETAFAYNASTATTFTSLGFNGRWGWTNGPLSAGTHTFTLYAGAGNNDLSKGVNVGTVTMVYNGTTATVTYQTVSLYKLEEVHLYVGSQVLPVKNGDYTIAPGQYPNVADDLGSVGSHTFTVGNLSGQVYLTAHATVSGF